MLLAIDIGNTNASLGVYAGDRLIAHWRTATIHQRTADEYGAFARQMFAIGAIDYKEISAVVVASVVPQLDFTFQKMSRDYFGREPVFVNDKLNLGLPIKCNPAAAIGADRIVDAVAAIEKYGAPVVVVDFGTATTFDAVNAAGEFLGGVIAPGISILSEALASRTARLPRVEIKKPETVVGTTTIGAIQSGLYFGYAGLVDGILKRMIEESSEENVRVVATGGLAPLISPASEFIETVDENLMLDGLRLIYEKIK